MSEVKVFSARSQCEHKKPYPSKSAARLAGRRYATKGAGRMGVYRCPHCDRWHVGHPPGGLVNTPREGE